MTRFEVQHRTVYRYGETMSRGNTVTHLVPRSGAQQLLERCEITVEPEPDERFEFDDAFGNHVVQFVVATPHDELAPAPDARVAHACERRTRRGDGSPGPALEIVAAAVA